MAQAVTIVGGGLAGLACGIRLRERGWGVTLHERQRYPLKKVCGEFLSPLGWRRVQALGAAEGLHPRLARRARFYADHRSSMDFNLDPPAWGITRGALDTALARRFQALGGDLREGSGLKPGPGMVDATGRPPAAGEAAWMGWKAYLPAALAPPEMEGADLLMLPIDGGYAGLLRVEGGRVSVALVARAPVKMKALLASHPVLAACAPHFGAHAAAAGFAFASRADAGRVGDARRVWPPVVGDGMSQALLAGEAMAAKLDGGGGGLPPGTTLRFAAARALHRLTQWPAGRGAMVALGRRFPGLPERLYRWTRG